MRAEDRPRSETSKHLSADGYDVQVQANAISHFLFTRLLMPALQIAAGARGKARIVNCTSAGREALAADVPAECFARHGAAAKAGGAKGAVAAGDGGARANAYGVVPAVAVAEERAQRRRPQRGGGGYCDVRERRQQSRKANLVFSMALRVRPPGRTSGAACPAGVALLWFCPMRIAELQTSNMLKRIRALTVGDNARHPGNRAEAAQHSHAAARTPCN